MSEQQAQAQAQAQQSISSDPKASQTSIILLLIFLGIWFIISLWAVIKSLLCTGKSGTTAEKVLGVVIAFFLGPFYFLYQYANKNYCLDEPTMPEQNIMPAVGGRRKHK